MAIRYFAEPRVGIRVDGVSVVSRASGRPSRDRTSLRFDLNILGKGWDEWASRRAGVSKWPREASHLNRLIAYYRLLFFFHPLIDFFSVASYFCLEKASILISLPSLFHAEVRSANCPRLRGQIFQSFIKLIIFIESYWFTRFYPSGIHKELNGNPKRNYSHRIKFISRECFMCALWKYTLDTLHKIFYKGIFTANYTGVLDI